MRPDVSRALPLAVIVVALVPAVALGSASPRSTNPVSDLDTNLLAELNAVRADHGLRPLRLDAGLTSAAAQHSLEMVEAGYFGHESADGSVFWKRIKRYYPRVGPGSWEVGENLLWRAPAVCAKGAVRAWLQSPGHRENLLGRSYRDVGIAAVHAVGAPGVYGQRQVVVLTVDFGSR
jgi:uncharacterized protein YkwD